MSATDRVLRSIGAAAARYRGLRKNFPFRPAVVYVNGARLGHRLPTE